MKNISNLLLLFICLVLASCNGEDYLDDAEFASNQLITDFTSNIQIDDLVRGAYFNLGSPNRGSAVSSSVISEFQSDIVSFKTYAGGNIAGSEKYSAPIYNREANENDLNLTTNSYRGSYMTLFSANDVLSILEETGGFPDESNGQRQINRMTGEVLFLRAYAHYQAATLFGTPYSSNPDALSIVLRTKRPIGATDLPARSTTEEVYQQIINDLKEAINLLPESYNASLGDPESYIDRAKRDAARFLLAKVYFHMGDSFWNSGLDGDGGAKEQIDILINSGSYPLEDGDVMKNNVFQQRGLGSKGSETVWQIAYYFRNGWRVPEFFWAFSSTIADPQNGRNLSRSYSFSNATLNKIGWDNPVVAANDKRYNNLYIRYTDSGGSNPDPNYASSYSTGESNVWCSKFGPNRQVQVPVFRSPELYLMRANILLGSNAAGAVADINVIRNRAGLTNLATVTDEDIEIEWIKELGFEGKRLFYLQALKKDVPAGDRSGSSISYDDPSLVRLFPADEISRNPALSN